MTDETSFENMKAAYHTLGCKLNFAETSTIGKLLAERGVTTAREGEMPDICVVNTCTVTELANKKCRQEIRRLSKLYPNATMVVTGCYAQLNAPEVAIVGLSRITTQPVWDGEQFRPRLILPLSLSYDHRVIDGVQGVRFATYLAKVLSDMKETLL